MEPAEITRLLERYWEAETSVEEEQQLAEYFRGPDIPAGLEPWREQFAWRDEASQVGLGPDFDQRLLKRISGMESDVPPRLPVAPVIRFRLNAAAAVIVSLGIGLLIALTAPRDAAPIRDVAGTPTQKTASPVMDTYNDPRQALAAVRNALLLASVRIHEGEHITQKNITRLHTSWEVATGD